MVAVAHLEMAMLQLEIVPERADFGLYIGIFDGDVRDEYIDAVGKTQPSLPFAVAHSGIGRERCPVESVPLDVWKGPLIAAFDTDIRISPLIDDDAAAHSPSSSVVRLVLAARVVGFGAMGKSGFDGSNGSVTFDPLEAIDRDDALVQLPIETVDSGVRAGIRFQALIEDKIDLIAGFHSHESIFRKTKSLLDRIRRSGIAEIKGKSADTGKKSKQMEKDFFHVSLKNEKREMIDYRGIN